MTWLPRHVVVVPIDFSDDSFAALSTAAELVDNPSHLHLVHVLPELEPADPGVIWHTIDDEDRARHAKKALHKELQQRGIASDNVEIRFGDAGSEIAGFAKQVEAGLVIVASHGKTGLKHLLIGSVAERVVRLVHCPVLVLKPIASGK